MQDIYRFLASYGLAREEKIEHRLRRFSEVKLSRFAESYLGMANERPLAVRAPAGAVDIYPDSWATPMPTALIKQLGIYANRIYVHDPLLKTAVEWGYLDFMPQYVIKHRTRDDRVAHFRARLASRIKTLLHLRPFVESGIVHLVPTELIQPRREPSALYADDLYGPEGPLLQESPQLPPEFLRYCDQHLEVCPAAYVDDEPVITGAQVTAPRRMVAIRFAGDPIPKFYHLSRIDTFEEPDSERYRFLTYFDIRGEQPIDPSTFRNWVQGSKQQTAAERVEHLKRDLRVAAMARARFITDLPVTKDLAQLDTNPETRDGSADVATALLKLDLPYFERTSLAAVAKARQSEAAFEEFRIALDKAFKEVEALPGSSEFQSAVDEVSRDILLRPLARIDQKMRSLQRGILIDATIAVGSLISTIVTQGNTLIGAAAILAASKALEMYKKDKAEEEKIRELPSFFYWQVTRKARKGNPG
jgi:hypothetical protein